jgi:hypothetical protein
MGETRFRNFLADQQLHHASSIHARVVRRVLPWSLWLRFELEERDRLLAVLQFLRPITTAAASDSRKAAFARLR